MPENIKTEKEINAYIQDYFENEGILLDKVSIKKNAGLRSISKLALNSFYGKFGQKNNMKKTKFVSDLGDMYNIFSDPTKEITDFHIMNENIMEIEFQNAHDFESLSFNSNILVASFCTSHARLKLWKYLHRIGARIIYFDTDSIIFIVYGEKNGDFIPELGTFLGEFTNELSCKEICGSKHGCEGHFIKEIVCAGPKNYAYRLNTGEHFCKVRGFSLNYSNSKILNFETMKKCIYSWINGEHDDVITVKTEIRRDKHEPKVYSREIRKNYGVVYDKRKVLKDKMTTVPFGYKI